MSFFSDLFGGGNSGGGTQSPSTGFGLSAARNVTNWFSSLFNPSVANAGRTHGGITSTWQQQPTHYIGGDSYYHPYTALGNQYDAARRASNVYYSQPAQAPQLTQQSYNYGRTSWAPSTEPVKYYQNPSQWMPNYDKAQKYMGYGAPTRGFSYMPQQQQPPPQQYMFSGYGGGYGGYGGGGGGYGGFGGGGWGGGSYTPSTIGNARDWQLGLMNWRI